MVIIDLPVFKYIGSDDHMRRSHGKKTLRIVRIHAAPDHQTVRVCQKCALCLLYILLIVVGASRIQKDDMSSG